MEAVEEKVDNTRLGNIRRQFECVIPDSWDLTTLGAAFKWRSGGTPLRTNPKFYGGDIPWLIIGDLNDGVVTEAATSITEEGLASSATRWVEEGSVLLAMYGSIGKLGIAGKPLTTNQAIAFTKADPHDAMYLFYYLMYSRESLTSLGKGATQKNISQAVIKEYPFPLAPLPEQRRIVSAIETQLGRLDAAVARLHAAKAKLKRYKQAVLKAAVENTGFDTEEELGSLAELVTSGSRGWAEYYAESGDLFIRAQNLKYDALDFDDIAYVQLPKKVDGLRTQVQKNDILITITGANVTKTALVTAEPDGRAFVNQHIALVRLKDPSQAPFVFRWIISPAHGRGILEKLAYGAGKPGLNLSHIRDLSIPIPSLKEQAKAVATLEAIDAANDELEATLDAQLLQSTRLRQAVLKRAFEGRLV